MCLGLQRLSTRPKVKTTAHIVFPVKTLVCNSIPAAGDKSKPTDDLSEITVMKFALYELYYHLELYGLLI